MVSIQVEGFGCLLCNFETAHEKALKAHILQKHNVDQGTVMIQIPGYVVSYNQINKLA